MAIQYQEPLDRTFHALGDGTRRGMIAMLARDGECTAGQLGAPFEIAQPTASRHLSVLEEAGLVKRTVHGREHRFRLQHKSLAEALDWIARHRSYWMRSLARLDAALSAGDEA